MKPLYVPKGRAKEYGDYTVNIYTGCPHRCYYCFAPQVLHRDREAFHSSVEPRKDIVPELRRQLEREQITGQLIHLCFTCDPYPADCDSTATREVISLLKEHGNHVQILTKGDGSRDFDLLDGGDWYGITLSCSDEMAAVKEPGAALPSRRTKAAIAAKEAGIKTWISFEPVLDAAFVMGSLTSHSIVLFDKIKIGKLNYWPSKIKWAQFGREVERICRGRGLDYYIKDSLRAEMVGGNRKPEEVGKDA